MQCCRVVPIVAVVTASFLPAWAAAQLPVPVELIEAETVYVEGLDVERTWLNHAGEEFVRQQRFTLIADRDQADLIVALRYGAPANQNAAIVPLPGVGAVFVESTAFTLTVVHRASEKTVWQDTRSITWAARGAVLDLVKDLHAALLEARPGSR